MSTFKRNWLWIVAWCVFTSATAYWFALQPGQSGAGPDRFGFRKRLAADSQPFEVVATRQVFWGELPWLAMLASAVVLAAALAALRAIDRQRLAR